MSLQEVIVVINAMQADGVMERYAIGGAIAATFYLEPVETQDVDVFVAFRPAPGSVLITPQAIFSDLTQRGYRMEGEYVVIGGWPVQFLPPTGPLVEEALNEAVTRDVDGVLVKVFSAEHLAAIALQTGRGKDKARLLQFLDEDALDSTRFQEILQRHGLAGQWQKFVRLFVREAS